MFFLSGVMVTLAATFLVVYNARPHPRADDAARQQVLGALLPSIKMAVAYPLANKMRTGMTMAMFCLVVFALTVMSSMNHNFNRLFLSDRALGGWDISVDENPTSPHRRPAGTSDRRRTHPSYNDIEAVGAAEVETRRNSYLVCQVRPDEPCDPSGNEDNAFTKYADARRGRQRSATNADPVPGPRRRLRQRRGRLAGHGERRLAGSGRRQCAGQQRRLRRPGLHQRTSTPRDTTFEPVNVIDRRPATGSDDSRVTVIGIIETRRPAHLPRPRRDTANVRQRLRHAGRARYYVKTVPGTDNVEAARQIESSLLTTGAQADSLKKC